MFYATAAKRTGPSSSILFGYTIWGTHRLFYAWKIFALLSLSIYLSIYLYIYRLLYAWKTTLFRAPIFYSMAGRHFLSYTSLVFFSMPGRRATLYYMALILHSMAARHWPSHISLVMAPMATLYNIYQGVHSLLK
jgi:hypothetical protein